MGNTCVGPNLGNNGFLQSVTTTVWKARQPDDTLPPPNGEASTTNNSVKSEKPLDSAPVSSKGGRGNGKGPSLLFTDLRANPLRIGRGRGGCGEGEQRLQFDRHRIRLRPSVFLVGELDDGSHGNCRRW
ncbi:Calcium-dependent protein kinase 20 [Sarracenia purpurea var. burkii]